MDVQLHVWVGGTPYLAKTLCRGAVGGIALHAVVPLHFICHDYSEDAEAIASTLMDDYVSSASYVQGK